MPSAYPVFLEPVRLDNPPARCPRRVWFRYLRGDINTLSGLAPANLLDYAWDTRTPSVPFAFNRLSPRSLYAKSSACSQTRRTQAAKKQSGTTLTIDFLKRCLYKRRCLAPPLFRVSIEGRECSQSNRPFSSSTFWPTQRLGQAPNKYGCLRQGPNPFRAQRRNRPRNTLRTCRPTKNRAS